MSGATAKGSASDRDGEGIFAVQLEVMGKLLDAERRKLSLLQTELIQQTKTSSTSAISGGPGPGDSHGGENHRTAVTSAAPSSSTGSSSTQHQQQRTEALQPSRTIQGEAVSRQRQNIARLQEQHDRLEAEYRSAAAGFFKKRSSSSALKGRSQPAIGLRQTTKQRPSIFASLPGLEGENPKVDDLSPIGEDAGRLRRKSSLAASFADVAVRSGRLSFVLADETSSIVYKNERLVSGTLEALIEHLVPTEKHYPDRTYIFAFLLTSRLYVQPHELMARVARQFRSIVGTLPGSGGLSRSRPTSTSESSSEEMDAAATPPASPPHAVPNTTPLALRPGVMDTAKNMVQFLSEWTESFAYDFRDERMMKHLKEITQACASLTPALRQSVGQVS